VVDFSFDPVLKIAEQAVADKEKEQNEEKPETAAEYLFKQYGNAADQ
jgi:hypothetical protein